MSSVASTSLNRNRVNNEVDCIKQAINRNIPSNNAELVWGINFIGNNLFKNWDSINSLYKNQEENESKYISSIVIVINDYFKNEKDKNELINYLFTSLVNKYSDTA